MQIKLCLVGALLSGAALSAQTQTQPPPPSGEVLKPGVYVRRFSAGATLSVLALPMIKDRVANVITTAPAFDGQYTTTGMQHRIGYGANVQLTVTERFAVNVSLFLRRVGYKLNSDIFEGTDNPATVVDDRKHTIKNEDTRARLYDLPVLVRFYGKERHTPGPRWFVEGGGALRRVVKIRTSIDTTIGANATTCCDVTPASARHTIRGLVAGAGVQLIDPVGIRVVPEVRYTRWTGVTFGAFSTMTQRNQIEGMISLTF